MKIKTVAFLASMALTSGCATAQDTGQLMSTVLGGMAGYKIADGLGGSSSEQAIGAVLGVMAGNAVLNHSREHQVYGGGVYAPSSRGGFYSACSRRVPATYAGNPGARTAWITGCENKMREQQAQFEMEAYQDGMQ
jgi:hypothetical protein